MEGVINSGDKCAVVESYAGLAHAYSHVADLNIMWLLHLCEAHQEGQAWAEAAQCAINVAAVIMHVRLEEGFFLDFLLGFGYGF